MALPLTLGHRTGAGRAAQEIASAGLYTVWYNRA